MPWPQLIDEPHARVRLWARRVAYASTVVWIVALVATAALLLANLGTP